MFMALIVLLLFLVVNYLRNAHAAYRGLPGLKFKNQDIIVLLYLQTTGTGTFPLVSGLLCLCSLAVVVGAGAPYSR
jgi:hypothetical protein